MATGYSGGLGGGGGGGSSSVTVTVKAGQSASSAFTRPTSSSWISSLQFTSGSNVDNVRLLASAGTMAGLPPAYAGLNVVPYADGVTQSLVDYQNGVDDQRFWGNISGFGYFVLQTEDGGGSPEAPASDIEIIVGFAG